MDASWGAFLDILEDKSERAGYLSERPRRSPVVLCCEENTLRTFSSQHNTTIARLGHEYILWKMREAHFPQNILNH